MDGHASSQPATAAAGDGSGGIRPADGPSRRPLSANERGLWLLHEHEPASPSLRLDDALLVQGPLDVDALRAAIEQVVARHEALTTAYAVDADGPYATALEVRAEVDVVEATSSGVADAVEAVRRSARLSLAHPPLLRAAIVRIDHDRHVVVLVGHRIALDPISLDRVWADISAAYAGDRRGVAAGARRSMVAAERDHLGSSASTADLDWWEEHLADALGPLDLHAGGNGAGRPTAQRTRLPGSLDAATATALVAVVLGRHSDQRDLVLASSDRPLGDDGREAVGPLERLMPIRIRLDGAKSFSELVAEVGAELAAVASHADAPLDEIVRRIGGDRYPALPVLPALARIVVRFDPHPRPPFALSGARTRRLGPYGVPAPGQLVVDVGRHQARGWMATLHYHSGTFASEAARRIASHLRVLAGEAAANPRRRLLRLALAGADERHLVTSVWSTTAGHAPPEPLGTLFERRVDTAPHAPAAEFGTETLDYASLDAAANCVAHLLGERGCTRGARVALFANRSLEFAVGTIAILKAGAACVPIDPAYPDERIAAMIASCRPAVVLMQRELDRQLGDQALEVVSLEMDASEHAAGPSERPGVSVSSDDVAYVLYTSGSIGEPRGVELVHRGLANHAAAVATTFGLTAADRVLQLSSLSFGISVEETIPTWIVGATVVFRPPWLPLGGREFLDWLGERRITVLDVPTAFWHEWVSDLKSLGATTPPSLRAVVVGGERALASAYADWLDVAAPGVRFFNTYGSTEISVCVTGHEPQVSNPTDISDDLPIGRPFQNTRTYVLDDELEPAAVGVAGELYVGGAAVARGYLDDPRGTAERFVPDPFSPAPGARMYRTRDRARFSWDGSLAFVGRRDQQVKIGGFRIEPAEIEHALRAHPAVVQAAVVVSEPRPGDRRLVAYVTTSRPAGESELRESLQRRLPSFMVPHAVVVLDDLPLTPNGKLARAALPAAAVATPRRDPDRPRSQLERTLAEIWADVLELRAVHRDAHFFELGGQSLLATQLVSRARSAGLDLPLRLLFEHPTFGGLVDALVVRAAEPPRG